MKLIILVYQQGGFFRIVPIYINEYRAYRASTEDFIVRESELDSTIEFIKRRYKADEYVIYKV